jgi:hypothetical protein
MVRAEAVLFQRRSTDSRTHGLTDTVEFEFEFEFEGANKETAVKAIALTASVAV